MGTLILGPLYLSIVVPLDIRSDLVVVSPILSSALNGTSSEAMSLPLSIFMADLKLSNLAAISQTLTCRSFSLCILAFFTFFRFSFLVLWIFIFFLSLPFSPTGTLQIFSTSTPSSTSVIIGARKNVQPYKSLTNFHNSATSAFIYAMSGVWPLAY